MSDAQTADNKVDLGIGTENDASQHAETSILIKHDKRSDGFGISRKVQPSDMDDTVRKPTQGPLSPINVDAGLEPSIFHNGEEGWNDVQYSEDGTEGNSKGNMIQMGSILRSVTNVGSAVTGSVSSFAGTMNKKLQNLFDDTKDDDENNNFGSSQDYKSKYLHQYGVSFTIPSLYVQASTWFPSDPSYFVQVVNYVVPSNDEYEVHTHYMEKDKPKLVNRFEDTFKSKITGCTIRVIQTQKDLNSIKLVDDFTFTDLPRIDHIDIKFSRDGKFFVLYSKENGFFRIYPCEDIEKILDPIREGKSLYEQKGIPDIEEISFGNNTKYIVVKYKQKMEVYHLVSMYAQQGSYKPKEYHIPIDELKNIQDFYFSSDAETEDYILIIACQVQGKKKIKIIDVNDLDKMDVVGSESNTINYFENLSDNFIIKIKEFEGKINSVFVNGAEQFLIEMNKNGETNQMKLTQIGSKQIKFVSIDKYTTANSNCYLYACDEYDESLHVYKADDIDFHLQIKRDILPNIIKVFDFIETEQGELKSLSLRDDEFIIDQAYEEQKESETITHEVKEQAHKIKHQSGKGCIQYTTFIKKSYIYSSVRAFSINWPYVVFSGLENFILLVNLYDRKLLHRIQFAPLGENVQVCTTFISNTKDLFVVVKKESTYRVLMLDFDSINANEGEIDENCFSFQLVLEYSEEEVHGLSLTSMVARGSSRKEVIQLNQKLCLFFLHEGKLFGWVQGVNSNSNGVLTPFDPDNKYRVMNKALQIRNDNSFYFIHKSISREESATEICEVQIGFSKFTLNSVLKENSQAFDYIAARVDRAQNKLIILMKDLQNARVHLKIVNIDDIEEIFLECEILDSEMRGILLSGQYKLVDGHIYYQNRVLKLRYDLMKQYGGVGTNQEVYFNKYEEVLALEQGETIKIDSPLDSMQAHRFGYIMLNNEFLSCKRLLIVPYLHERRVYLNRMKKNTNYFYSSVQRNISNDIESPVWVSYIFAFNLNESKFYVYSEKGLLLNRIEYSDYTQKHGDIVSTSPDGLNFVLHNKVADTVSIIRFDEEKVQLLKTIKVNQSLLQYLKTKKFSTENHEVFDSDGSFDQIDETSYAKDVNHWMLDPNRRNLEYEIQINNQSDILIQISSKIGSSDETVYFFNANFKMNKNLQSDEVNENFMEQCRKSIKNYKDYYEDFKNLQGQNLMVLKKRKKFTITHDKIFLWDNHKIEYYSFKQQFCRKNRHRLRFQISKSEKYSHIEKVSAQDGTDNIAIIVQQLQCAQVFSWSLTDDIENKAFELEKDHEIIWDQQGEFLILSKDKITLPIQNCNLKCFVQEDFENRGQSVSCDGLNYMQGYRFDFVNHNWIIMKHYIQMSFSYMTFVIQGKFEEIDVDGDSQLDPLLDKAFDLEAFTYMLNKNSCFSSGTMAREDFKKLSQVLKKLLEMDEVYLEVLHYTIVTAIKQDEDELQVLKVFGDLKSKMLGENESTEEIKSALHEAFREGNNRVVDIILSYMAKISINNSEIFKEVLKEVTDLQNFGQYLANIQTQTQQMIDKKLLKIAEPINDSIIAMATSHTAYVDDDFFQNQFGEDKNNASYKVHPVEVLSLKIGWIVNTPEGKEFLQAILMGERLDYYEIKSLQIIIEYLYQKSKSLLLKYLLPLYLLQGINFVLSIIFQELRFKSHESGEELTWISKDGLHSLTNVIIFVNQVQTLIMLIIMGQIFYFTGKSFFYRVYTWFDVFFYTLNTIASQLSLTDGLKSQELIRKLQAAGILLFLAKNFYFMKLVDNIAPLIDIIIRIFIDIKWFMFLFFCFIVCFGFSFFLLGQNQTEYDGLTQDQIDGLPYRTLNGSILFMWNVCLGGGDTSHFDDGAASQYTYLQGLYIAAQFTMLIHMLNMLIAIMGDTFGQRNEVAEQIKIKDHLAFVIDNWYLKDYALGDPKKIKYIITAFSIESEQEDNELIEGLIKSVGGIKEQISVVHEEVTKRQHKQEMATKRQEIAQRMFEKEINGKMKSLTKTNEQNQELLQKLVNNLVN